MCLLNVGLDRLVLIPPVLQVIPVLTQLGVNTVQRLKIHQQSDRQVGRQAG